MLCKKEEAVIKVIIERQVKKGENLAPLLRELRATAIHQPGYVTGETLVDTEDSSNIVVVSIGDTSQVVQAD